jgi:hypothetical protein
MKIEAEKMGERVATEELVRELVRNDARRGEFMIMSDDADDSRFVQVACDYDEVGGKSDGLFDLEYRDGKNGYLYHCSRRVSADEVERVFLDFLERRTGWRQDFSWERQNMGVGGGFSTPRFKDMPTVMKVANVLGGIAFVVFGLIFVLPQFCQEEIKAVLSPGAELGNWIAVAVFVVAFIGLPAGLFKWLRTRGKEREAHVQMIAAEGVRLRRVLPHRLWFMAIWCCGWDAAAFYGLVDAVRAYSEKGFNSGIVIGVVFLLIGIAITVYFFRLVWKHLRPCYEVRLLGGVLKEGERAAFEYEFKGNAEDVGRVEFATAVDDLDALSRRTLTLNGRKLTIGAPPGRVNDTKKFFHPMELVSGRVSLEMPRIASYCHDRFRYYFRATVTFKSGLVVSSSYRIPLK